MTRKRGPGAGRKPKGEFSRLTSPLSIRMPPEMRKQLEAEATARGRSLTQELLRRLYESFNRDYEKDRDPALRALIFMIAQIAEHISGGIYLEDKTTRSKALKEWRTDPFRFAAFKIAVRKFLETLEAPHGKSALSKEGYIGGAAGLADLELQNISILGLRTAKDEYLRGYLEFGKQVEREFYGLPEARRALGLKAKGTKS